MSQLETSVVESNVTHDEITVIDDVKITDGIVTLDKSQHTSPAFYSSDIAAMNSAREDDTDDMEIIPLFDDIDDIDMETLFHTSEFDASVESSCSLPLLECTPEVLEEILTPESSICGELEDPEGENELINLLTRAGYDMGTIRGVIEGERNQLGNEYNRNRPRTDIFFQNKIYTYDKFEEPSTSKVKVKSYSNRLAPVNGKDTLNEGGIILNPNAVSFVACESENVNITNKVKELRCQNVGNVIIGHLNINSLRYKFEDLCEIIDGYVDIMIIGETKLDESFPSNQFMVRGYKKPYRKDRNANGGGVMIYVREDIPSLEKENFLPNNIEAIAVEINLRKNKLLLIGTYHSTSIEYGCTDDVFFNEIGNLLDRYTGYDRFLIAGDLNIEEGDDILDDFIECYSAKNLVKEPTCFKNPSNPSCIDLFITNSYQSFMKTTAVSNGLSDFHKMTLTVMKTVFPKAKPKLITYRHSSKYNKYDFKEALERNLFNQPKTYETFQNIFLRTLNEFEPLKTKYVRANNKSYVDKEMRKAIMLRTQLQNLYWKYGTEEFNKGFKRQKNYCNRLYKRTRKRFYENLDLNKITDNRKFWFTVKPLIGDKGGARDNIVLLENEEIINNDDEIAEVFMEFFANQVDSLGIVQNELLLNKIENSDGRVADAIKMYESHPSILKIKENVVINTPFSFEPVTTEIIEKEIQSIKTRKGFPFMDIPPERLKDVIFVVSDFLRDIWNVEILQAHKFSTKLKFSDLAPIHKKLDTIFKKNYRGVNILPIVSKIFERIMDKQVNKYIEEFLSVFLCGYRKFYSPQHAVLVMTEHWKKSLDEGGYAGGVLMDLSKAFDTINHKLLIAKLHAYGFDIESLEIVYDYLSERWQRTKINMAFSTWSEMTCGAPPGSVLGPKLFNIYLNDLFYLFIDTKACNIADDTTPYACNMDLKTLLRDLESDVASAIFWFEANDMLLNELKCHFLMAGNTEEKLWVTVGGQVIWESMEEVLLGVNVDKKLLFEGHIMDICKKASVKVTALGRLARIIPFKKKKLLMSAFVESQFSYCPLVWMFCSKKLNAKINRIQERVLRMVYLDYTSSFEDLLKKDGAITVHMRNIQLVAIEMYKIVNDIGPKIMKDLVEFKPVLRRDENDKVIGDMFVKAKVKTEFMGKGSFRYFGPVVWDQMLPNDLKSIETLDKFKTEVKKWIPHNCKCRLCDEYIRGVGKINRPY